MPKKGEKVTDPDMLERLKQAREKANEKRKEMAEYKRKQKLLQDIERQKHSKEVDTKLAELTQPPEQPANAEPKKKPTKKVVYVSSSDSESEEEVVYKRKPKPKPPQPPQPQSQATPQQQYYAKIYSNLFG